MAANAGAIRAGRAFVEAFLDDKKLIKGLRSVQKRLHDFGSQITGIGAAISGLGVAASAPFIAATKIFAETGSALSDMSARTGVGVEALSELDYAAKQSGTSSEAVGKGFIGLAKTMMEARNGSKGTLALFDKLGLSLDDLKNMSPDEQFMAFGEAISKIEDPVKRAAIAMDLFGKSGVELLPLFADGAAGVARLRNEARDLGLVMSSEDAAAADTLGDKLDALWGQFKRVFEVVGGALAPAMTRIADIAINVSTAVIQWVDQNRELVTTIAGVIAGVAAAGAALVVIGGAFMGLSSVLGMVISGVTTVVSVIGFLLSPIGLVSAAIVGLAVYFATSSGAIQQVIDYLGGVFGDLSKDALKAFGAIKDALMAGEFKAAAAVAWAGLKMVWTEGTGFLLKEWDNWCKAITDSFAKAMTKITKGFAIAQNWIAEKMLESGLFGDNVAEMKVTLQEDFERKMKGIDSGAAQDQEQRDKAFEQKVTERADEVKKAREEFEKAVGAAKEAAGAGAGASQFGGIQPNDRDLGGALGGMSPEMQAFMDKIAAGMGELKQTQSAWKLGGTSSAEAERQIVSGIDAGESDRERRDSENLKTIAKNTNKMVNKGQVYS